eukprot:scaffold4943_cov127-Isochrysis_galbana.AAC.7
MVTRQRLMTSSETMTRQSWSRRDGRLALYLALLEIDAEGTLSMSERMAKRLDVAKIGHVGKNIRIFTTDEQ